VVTEYDLWWYNPAYMPPEVFEYSTVLYGPERLTFATRPPMLSALEHLWGCLQRLRRDSTQHFSYVTNAWHLKDLASLVLFLPVLYLGAQGRPCYKKFSFDRARADFSDDEWEAVRVATKLRAQWKPFDADERCLELRDRVLRTDSDPLLFQESMASLDKPLHPDVTRVLEATQFYQSIMCLTEAMATRIKEWDNVD
jgi:hypothetical protein